MPRSSSAFSRRLSDERPVSPSPAFESRRVTNTSDDGFRASLCADARVDEV